MNMMHFLKIALSANEDKKIQSIDSIESYPNETSKHQYAKKKILNVTT